MSTVAWQMAQFSVSALTTLFFAIDPVAAVPLFLAMTDNETEASRRRMVRGAALVTAFTLSGFAVAGNWIFRFFGISLDAFRVAGGALLFLLALDMLRAEPSRQRSTPEERSEGRDKPDVSVFPLGIPILAGPGAITSVLMLVAQPVPGSRILVVLAVALVVLLTFFILRSAAYIEKRFRRTGLNVVQRLMGLVLAGVAVQFMLDGVRRFWFGLGS
jgi:multiple antibiotic resistance protein